MKLNDKQHGAILAGLRLLQTALDNRLVLPNDGDIGDILTNSGAHMAITPDEIDAFCERFNVTRARSLGDSDMTKLEELKAAYEDASTGEWVTGKGGTAYYPLQIRCDSGDWDSLIAAFHSWDAQKESNAKFIAIAHNLMPTLLDAVAALRAVSQTYRTFRNVPIEEQQWTSLDDEALEAAFEALEALK